MRTVIVEILIERLSPFNLLDVEKALRAHNMSLLSKAVRRLEKEQQTAVLNILTDFLFLGSNFLGDMR